MPQTLSGIKQYQLSLLKSENLDVFSLSSITLDNFVTIFNHLQNTFMF